MASFQKRGSTWQFTVSAKPKPIRKGGFKTKKEAQVAAAEIEAELQKGIVPHLRLEPFNQYFSKWIKDYKTDISDITLKRYRDSLKTIEKYFGGKPIQHITKRDYQQFLNDYALTHAKESTRKLNVHIRACVQTAIEEGIIRIDFTRKVIVTGNIESKREEEKYLNFEESQRLLNELYKRLDRSLGYYMLLLALTSGMRYAEIVGLTKKDFNFKTNKINVDKTWKYKTGEGFGPTKNNKSRVIEMDKHTMNMFEDLFDKTPDNVLRLVFYSPNSKSKVITNAFANKILKKTINDLNQEEQAKAMKDQRDSNLIEPITMHGLRHTHASISLYRKISVYYVSERLGHTSIDTTQRYYAHIINELREEDAKNTINIFENMVKLNVV
ncbi:tyrosine-type recombinase/integrase [Schinkia azotoformans]|uniref:site-specific integrase n=1 Tax=Schinkia azotoformans TaxID=1454 RepID=UPI002E1DF2A1|nr:tyrosine-type recombinase/integrase [Schinkia azotoformans]MED4350886.1 tyrosine-type recombinase/integrase [Schinkia azotoformans]